MKKQTPQKKFKQSADRRAEMQELTDRLQDGVNAVRSSQGWKDMLQTMAKFHTYSVNNQILIAMQKPDATLVGSYTTWKSLGRQVNRGEHGIKILCPAPYRKTIIEDKKNPDGKPVIGSDGRPVTEEKQVTVPAYKIGYTFDISQTSGKEIPKVGPDELSGSVNAYEQLKSALESISSVPIRYDNIKTGAKGYCTPYEIVVKQGMGEIQTLKTLIHEETHSRLHFDNADRTRLKDGQSPTSREVQAESVAYVVCQHYGIDTSDYSFAYIAGWENADARELQSSMETIRQTASGMIDDIDRALSPKQYVITKAEHIDQQQSHESHHR